MIGPRCPACGARVKMPKNAPLPPPHAKVKCPTCGGVGELEAFLLAGGNHEEIEVIEDATPAVEETKPTGAPAARPAPSGDTGTRISGSASKLNLPPGIRCTLTVISGPDSGRKINIEKPRIVVGRNSGDLPLNDEEVSTQHCAFEISGVNCTVKDLESKNGTWVSGQRITSTPLDSMSEVVVGATTLLFTMTLDDTPPGG